ncbi:GYD domain-containing protein [Pseudonocardia halophobica]|uniref:GYD domain-containing protein n=1 Tax=Pseudonocardia halophobica TaxID=29401 RepID=A0A9W6L754_9PSEU|nr:GYD domain-containing protein [Pseudonocardia halophobica]GLL13191.1 GYD domain-containing protein [Pseudonocardia halophobica]
MAKFAFFFSYSPETWNRMVLKPSDRTAAVRTMLEAQDARLEALYYMFGGHDGIVIFDAPDSRAAAAISLAVTASGAFDRHETRELITPDELVGVLEKAGLPLQAYVRPGD